MTNRRPKQLELDFDAPMDPILWVHLNGSQVMTLRMNTDGEWSRVQLSRGT